MYTIFLLYITGKIILKKTVRGQKKSELPQICQEWER